MDIAEYLEFADEIGMTVASKLVDLPGYAPRWEIPTQVGSHVAPGVEIIAQEDAGSAWHLTTRRISTGQILSRHLHKHAQIIRYPLMAGSGREIQVITPEWVYGY